jgi:hypothetical protein
MKSFFPVVIGFSLALASLGSATNEVVGMSGEALLTRSYTINSGSFVKNLGQLMPAKSGESHQELLLRFVKANKVEIQKPTVVLLDEPDNRLLVRATEINMEKIEQLVVKVVNLK